jgi:riboflavin synthase
VAFFVSTFATMFTGIIEAMGTVVATKKESANLRLTIQSPFTNKLKPDQSVAHNGVCLTVEKVLADSYEIVAIEETLKRSNLGKLTIGDHLNLERSLKVGDRLDGHFVQGHVDETAVCTAIESREGSWLFTFQAPQSASGGSKANGLLVEKGSVCINGVALTIVNVPPSIPPSGGGGAAFSVAIIPYTYEHTNFKTLKKGDLVNIEYDILGKYVQKMMEMRDYE